MNEDNTECNSKTATWKDKYKFPFGAVLLIFFTWVSGMGSYCYILSMPIYMASILGFSDTKSTVIYHAKSGVSYLFNIVGAVLADSVLGRVKSYFVFQPFDVVIMIGIAILSIYSMSLGIVILYFLLAIVGGCVGPALRTIVADQIPSDNPIMLSTYLHIIYLINNFGVILVAYVAPILHKDIYCFGLECYPLVFAVSFFLTLISFFMFIFGYCTERFVVNQPTNNLFKNIFRCIHLAVKQRIKLGKPAEGKSMLDYAETQFDASFIRDLKITKGLFIFLLAHPLFWTVFEQLSSIWTLQAQYMDGMLTESFVIKPDQMVTLNPILVVILIPIFEILIYPLLDKLNIRVPYRIMAGQMFTALACVSMIFIQLRIDKSLSPVNDAAKIQINVANFGLGNLSIGARDQRTIINQDSTSPFIFDRQSYVLFQSGSVIKNTTFMNRTRISTVLVLESNVTGLEVMISDVRVQDNGGYAFVRTFNLGESLADPEISLKAKVGINKVCKLRSKLRNFGDYVKCSVGEFDMFLGERKVGMVTLYPAETKILIIKGQNGSEKVKEIRELILTLPNILWQIIPYVLVTIGEVLFNVNTGIFLYGEAPMSMKSILLAAQYVCIAIGNILILLLKQILKDVSNKYLFLICGILVTISGVFTGVLGYFYLKNKSTMDSSIECDSNMTEL